MLGPGREDFEIKSIFFLNYYVVYERPATFLLILSEKLEHYG